MMCRANDIVILEREPDERYVVVGFPGRGSGLIELVNTRDDRRKTVHHKAVVKRNPL